MDPILLLAFITSINITAPTQYENNEVLPSSEIKNYEVCFSSIPLGPCQVTRTVTGNVITDLPTWTREVKARTVLQSGAISNWSNTIAVDNRKPMAPILLGK